MIFVKQMFQKRERMFITQHVYVYEKHLMRFMKRTYSNVSDGEAFLLR